MKTCMVAYSYYERDNRVRRYAEALMSRGDTVDVVSLRHRGQADYGEINGAKVHRIQPREVNEKGKFSYFSRVARFFVRSAIFLSREHHGDPYDLIHVHSVPDFEVFAAFLPKLKGAKIILDIHDLVPELYCSKFGTDNKSMIFKSLALIERYSACFADHVIASNHIWCKKLIGRSVPEDKCSVMLNYPDGSLFSRRTKKRDDGKLTMIYPGTLNWHQGLDIAVRAFSAIKDKVPEAEFHIFGEGPSKPALMRLIKELHLDGRALIHGMQPIHKIAEIMSAADLGIVPKRNDPFGGEAFSTKILEFMSLGVPLIVSRTKIDAYYFNDSVVRFFEPDNEVDLAESMLMLLKDGQKRADLAHEAQSFVEQFFWETKKEEYLNLVDSLFSKGRNRGGPASQ